MLLVLQIVLVITICTLPPIQGIRCFQCNTTTDQFGNQTGCKNEILLQQYLLECEPPAINTTKAVNTISNITHVSNPGCKPGKHVPLTTTATTTIITGVYCFAQLSLVNGKLFLQRGCSSLKSSADLYSSCATPNFTQTTICYCGFTDGCNGHIHYEHHEDEYVQGLNSSKYDKPNEESSNERDRHNPRSSNAVENTKPPMVFAMVLISLYVNINM